jgi:hypothetical protein
MPIGVLVAAGSAFFVLMRRQWMSLHRAQGMLWEARHNKEVMLGLRSCESTSRPLTNRLTAGIGARPRHARNIFEDSMFVFHCSAGYERRLRPLTLLSASP